MLLHSLQREIWVCVDNVALITDISVCGTSATHAEKVNATVVNRKEFRDVTTAPSRNAPNSTEFLLEIGFSAIQSFVLNIVLFT